MRMPLLDVESYRWRPLGLKKIQCITLSFSLQDNLIAAQFQNQTGNTICMVRHTYTVTGVHGNYNQYSIVKCIPVFLYAGTLYLYTVAMISALILCNIIHAIIEHRSGGCTNGCEGMLVSNYPLDVAPDNLNEN